MATKNWLPTTASNWNTSDGWSPSGAPSVGDNAVFNTNIASNADGVVTLSGGDTQVSSMSLSDSSSPYYSWTIDGASDWDMPAGGGEVTVANATSTIKNVIKGIGPLVKKGAAELVLSGNNTFSGGLSIEDGRVKIIDGSQLGSTKKILLKNYALNAGAIISSSAPLDTSWFDANYIGGTIEATLSGTTMLTNDSLSNSTWNLRLKGNNTNTGGFKLISRNDSTSLLMTFDTPQAMNNNKLYFQHNNGYRSPQYYFGPPSAEAGNWTLGDIDFGTNIGVTNSSAVLAYSNLGSSNQTMIYSGSWTGGTPAAGIIMYSQNPSINTRHVLAANLQNVTAASILFGYNVSQTFEIASASSIPPLANCPLIGHWPGTQTKAYEFRLTDTMTIPQVIRLYGTYERSIAVPASKVVTHTGKLLVSGVLYVTGAGAYTNTNQVSIDANSGIIYGPTFSGSLSFTNPSNSIIGGIAGAVINPSVLDSIIPQGIGLQLEGATFTSNYPVDVSKISGLASGLTGSLMLNVTGSGGITKIGTGRLALGGTNTFTLPVTHSAGTLHLSNSNSAGAAAGAKIMHNLSTAPTTTILSADTALDTSILDNYLYVSIAANLSGTAPIRKSYNTYMTYLSGNNTHTGGTIIDCATATQIYANSVNAYGVGPLIYSGSSSSTANLDFYLETMANETLTNNIYFTPAIGRRRIFKRADLADTIPTKLTIAGNISGTITNEAFVIRTFGPGSIGRKLSTIEVSGDNSGLDAQFLTFAGASDGSYIYNGQSSLPKTTTGIRWQTSTWDGNTMTFSGSLNIPNYVEIWGIGRNLATPSGQTTTVSGMMGITGSSNVDAVRFVGPGDWVQNGVIAGAGSVMVSGSQGRLTLGASNTYAGSTFVTGTLIAASGISSDMVFGTTPGVATPNKLLFANGSRFVSSASFQISSNRGIRVDGNTTFDVASGKTLTYGGIMAGSGLFNKAGAGTVTLSGLNTLTGGVSVNEGVLEIPVIDTIISGSVTVTQNGHLKASNYSGSKVLKVNSTLTFAGGTLTIG